jgi:heterodisulfide reductase subunit C
MLVRLLDAWGRVAVDSTACSRYEEVCPRVVRGLEEVRRLLEVMIKSGCLDKSYSEVIESISSMIRWVGGGG